MIFQFLLNSLYIGERDRLARIEQAAREAREAAERERGKMALPTEEQLREAAGRFRVEEADVARRAGEMAEPPPEDTIGAGRAAVIAASYKLQAARAAGREEEVARLEKEFPLVETTIAGVTVRGTQEYVRGKIAEEEARIQAERAAELPPEIERAVTQEQAEQMMEIYERRPGVVEDDRIDIRGIGILPSGVVIDKVREVVSEEDRGMIKRVQERFDIGIEERQREYLLSGEYLRQQKELGKEQRLAQYGIGLGYVGFRAFKGFTTPFIHPIETVKGLYELVRHPFKGVTAMVTAFKEEPVGYPAEFVGGILGLRYIGKAAKPVVKPVVEAIPKPKIRKVTISEKPVYRGAVLETRTEAIPLLGRTPEGIQFLMPTYKPKIPIIEPYTPVTPTEAAIALRAVRLAAPETTRITAARTVMRALERQPSAFVQKTLGRDVKSLPPRGVDTVISFAKRERADVYGSLTMEAQMRTGKLGRKIADIDVQLKVSEAVAQQKARELAATLRKQGINARVSTTNPTLVETFTEGKWHHAVDIHSIETSEIMGAELAEGAWGFQYAQPRIPIGGVSAMRLSESGLRKGGSILGIRRYGEVMPQPHRMKDITDFYRLHQEQILSAMLKGKPIKAAQARAALKKWKQTYPKEIQAMMEAEAAATEMKVPLYISGKRVVSPPPSMYAGVMAGYAAAYPPVSRRPSYPISELGYPPSYAPSPYPSISPRPSVSPMPSISARPSYPSPMPSIAPSFVSPYPSPPSPYPSPPSPYPSPYPSISPMPSISPAISPAPSPPPSYPPSPPPPSRPSFMKRISPAAEIKRQGYNVLIKRKLLKKGKGSYKERGYEKANPKPLTRTAALGMMAGILDTYTNRSGRIERTKKKAVVRKDLEQKWRMLREKFRTAKRNRNILVEKTMFAIDSREEVAGIPYESIRQRQKQALIGIIAGKKKQIMTSFVATKKQEVATKRAFNFMATKQSKKKKKQKGVKFL